MQHLINPLLQFTSDWTANLLERPMLVTELMQIVLVGSSETAVISLSMTLARDHF